MKHKNWTLGLGSLMLLLLIFTLIFPELISSKNPYALSFIKFWTGASGELKMATPPYPPSSLNPLGSDQMGRDMLSFLIYGSRLTLLLSLGVAVCRFLVAVPLGIAAGMKRALPERLIDRFNLVLTTIPPLLIAILILRMDFLSSLYRSQSTIIFICTLTLIGWSKIASIISKSTAHLMTETYILSERAIGKRPLAIAKSHVLPHLVPEILILFFMEIASVLTLMMQLGLFSVFVGNLKIIRDSARDGFSYFNVTFEPEWSSLLGSARDYIRVAPWIALAAGAMFFFTVLAFNLLGEGLRLEFQKKNQHFGRQIKQLLRREVIAIGLVLVILVAWLKWPPTYDFAQTVTPDSLKASQINSLSPSEQLNKQIKDHMITLELEPIENTQAFVQSFDKRPVLTIQSETVRLETPLMSTLPEPLKAGTDYQLLSGKPVQGLFFVVDATKDFYAPSEALFKDKLLYVDTELVPMAAITSALPKLKAIGIVGLVLNQGISKAPTTYDDLLILSLSETQHTTLKRMFKDSLMPEFVIDLKASAADEPGQNILGKLVGNEPSMAQNMIIIGMDCSASTPEKQQEKLAFYLNLMTNIKAQEARINRTIVFAFFDGSEGLDFYTQHALMQNKKVNLYLDLTEIDSDHYAELEFSDELAPISRYYGFIFSNQFKANGKRLVAQKRMPLSSEDRLLFMSEGLTTLNFKTAGRGNLTLEAFGKAFVKTLVENTY